jgi:hypothetical protein
LGIVVGLVYVEMTKQSLRVCKDSQDAESGEGQTRLPEKEGHLLGQRHIVDAETAGEARSEDRTPFVAGHCEITIGSS